MKTRLLTVVVSFLAGFYSVQAVRADALDNWQWRNPLPTANPMRSVAYGNGKFVAVGESGLMLTSLDGVAWDLLPPVSSNSLNRVTFGNGGFVAIGEAGAILASNDVTNWAARSSGTTNHLLAITYGNGMFMAVGTAGKALVSTNATQWSAVNPGVVHDLNWITFGNNLFLMPGSPTNSGLVSQVLRTSDGINWSQSPVLPSTVSTLFQATFGNNQFVAYLSKTESGYNIPYFYSSTDGIHWSQRSSAAWALGNPTPVYASFGSVAFANGRFFEVEWRPPYNFAAATWISVSGDAQSWTNSIQSDFYGVADLAYGAGNYVMVGTNGIILSSTDGVNWALNTKGGRNRITGMAAGNNVKVAVGDGVPLIWNDQVPDRQIIGLPAPILVSSNGSEFSPANSGSTQMLSRVSFGAGMFVAVGDGGALQRSTNGNIWTAVGSGTTKDLLASCRGTNLWVAVGADGTIITSPTGLSWTTRSSGTTYTFYGVTYDNGTYVAVGYFGTVATSTDGINWTIQYSGTTKTLFNVVHGNGIFVAAGEAGTIITSSDGESWTTQSSGTAAFLYGLAFGRGQFVAVGAPQTGQPPIYGNVLLQSYDGSTWQTRKLPTAQGVYNVNFVDDSFWVSGGFGTVLQSDVVPNQPLLAGRRLVETGENELSILGVIPPTCRIQVCTNLSAVTWYDVAAFTNGSPPCTWVDHNGGDASVRFYRVASP